MITVDDYTRGRTFPDALCYSFYPIDRLREAVADGRIAAMPDHVLGCYNNYSQRKVLEQEAPKALAQCQKDGIDALIMVPV